MTTLDKACIATQLFDLNGWVYLTGILLSSSDTRSRMRRLNRSKTLDGEVYIDDLGFTHGDRTIALSFKVDADTESKLYNIIQNHSLIWLSLTEGAFVAVIESITMRANKAKMNILIKSSA